MESTTVKAEPYVHDVKTCCLAQCGECAKSSIPDAPDWVANSVDELREIANWMDDRQHTENAGFIRKAASQLEVLAGAYETSKSREFPKPTRTHNAGDYTVDGMNCSAETGS